MAIFSHSLGKRKNVINVFINCFTRWETINRISFQRFLKWATEKTERDPGKTPSRFVFPERKSLKENALKKAWVFQK